MCVITKAEFCDNTLSVQVEPFLPYEYTCEGMLERLHAYIQNQVGGRDPQQDPPAEGLTIIC